MRAAVLRCLQRSERRSGGREGLRRRIGATRGDHGEQEQGEGTEGPPSRTDAEPPARASTRHDNAGEQHPQDSIDKISPNQLERTFRTNIFSMFYLTSAALPHLKKGCTIINTTSVTAYRGSPTLLDYAATKGAIVAFTRSLSMNLADKKIRVNAVAPGPI